MDTVEKLKECEDNVRKTVEMMLTELSPFDVKDEDVINFEDRLERLGKCLLPFQIKSID